MTVKSAIEQATKSMLDAMVPPALDQDILETLEMEHDEVQELLTRLTESSSARDQKSLVTRIKKALIPHARAEEKVVYDVVLALRKKDAKVDGNEGYIEHRLADQTLKNLDKLKPNTPQFKATAKVLKELLDHHIKEEESDIWAKVRDNFTHEQRARMARDFQAAKKKVKVA